MSINLHHVFGRAISHFSSPPAFFLFSLLYFSIFGAHIISGKRGTEPASYCNGSTMCLMSSIERNASGDWERSVWQAFRFICQFSELMSYEPAFSVMWMPHGCFARETKICACAIFVKIFKFSMFSIKRIYISFSQ